MSNIDLNAVHLTWCVDILNRIYVITHSDKTDELKLEEIKWLAKQGLKVNRED